MKTASIIFKGRTFTINLDNPHDISIPIRKKSNVNTFFLPQPSIQTINTGQFTGDVNRGGSCNVDNILISPHGNGTHTECIGHISKTHETIYQSLNRFFFLAALITVKVQTGNNGNSIISPESIDNKIKTLNIVPEALIIRTLPNDDGKLSRIYSGNNPPFIPLKTMEIIVNSGLTHLLTDLPSLDKEDDPDLKSHHCFFGYPHKPQKKNTVTELIYVPDSVNDGYYWLNLQVFSLESDASPSKPVLYKILS